MSPFLRCWYALQLQKRRRLRRLPPVPAAEPSFPQDYVLRLSTDSLDFSSPGDPVAYWPDSSGQGNHTLQDTVEYQPTLQNASFAGKEFKVVQFDSDDDGMETPLQLPTGTPFSIFALWRPLYPESACALISSASLDWTMGTYSNEMLCFFGSWTAMGSINTEDFFLFEVRITPGSQPSDIFLNGIRATIMTNGGSAAPGPVTFGASGLQHYPGGCQTPEIVIYNRHLSEPEAIQVRSYFQQKYNYLKL